MKRTFTVVIEKDEDGYFVASVPQLKGCHTQAKTQEELIPRIREVIELCMEEEEQGFQPNELVGVEQVD